MKVFFENFTFFICMTPIFLGYFGIIVSAVVGVFLGLLYPLILLLGASGKLNENSLSGIETSHLERIEMPPRVVGSPREEMWYRVG